MSSIELLDLPNEILELILSHIPGHFVFANVCRKFYELDCRKNRNLHMNIDFSKFKDDQSISRSILTSNRVIESAHIKCQVSSENLKLLKEIMQRHGSSLKNVKFDAKNPDYNPYFVSKKTFENLLSCFPSQIVELDLTMKKVRMVEVPVGAEWKSDSIQKFTQLKHLAIDNLFVNPKRIPESLESVNLDFFEKLYDSRMKDPTSSFFRNFSAYTEELLSELANRKIRSLQIEDFSSVFINTFSTGLKNLAPNLKVLDIGSSDYDEMISLATNVEKLKVKAIYSGLAQRISKLTNLRSLEVAEKWGIFEELSLVNTVPNIEAGQKLHLTSLKVFLPEHNLNFFLQNFTQLESLDYTHFEKHDVYVNDGQIYPNLKRLVCRNLDYYGGLRDDTNFYELLEALPNLEEIVINETIYVSVDFIAELKLRLGKIRKIQIGKIFCRENIYGDQSVENLRKFPNLDSVKFHFHESIYFDESFLIKLQGYYKVKGSVGSFYLKK